MCCSPWGCKETDPTEWLNNNKDVDLALTKLSPKELFCPPDLLCHWICSHSTPPSPRIIPFPDMNIYSDLLSYRLCLRLRYKVLNSFSFLLMGRMLVSWWSHGPGHVSQDVSVREAVSPWDICLWAVISSSFRTAIIISLEVAMTGPAWGANDVSEKLFLSC